MMMMMIIIIIIIITIIIIIMVIIGKKIGINRGKILAGKKKVGEKFRWGKV